MDLQTWLATVLREDLKDGGFSDASKSIERLVGDGTEESNNLVKLISDSMSRNNVVIDDIKLSYKVNGVDTEVTLVKGFGLNVLALVLISSYLAK